MRYDRIKIRKKADAKIGDLGMKKLIIIIIILATILVGMVIYKNIAIQIKNNENVSVQEIDKIQTYITKIYMWKEITGDALPIFEDINQVDDTWLWEVVKKNIEEYEIHYEVIEDKTKELFGPSLQKQFPKEGTSGFVYDEALDIYNPVSLGLDEKEDLFFIEDIQKGKDGYEVTLVEYLEDYTELLTTPETEEYEISIKNIREEEVERMKNTEQQNIVEFVKNNADKFSKKKVFLKQENDAIYVQKVEDI